MGRGSFGVSYSAITNTWKNVLIKAVKSQEGGGERFKPHFLGTLINSTQLLRFRALNVLILPSPYSGCDILQQQHSFGPWFRIN